jgi:hypothetical protein
MQVVQLGVVDHHIAKNFSCITIYGGWKQANETHHPFGIIEKVTFHYLFIFAKSYINPPFCDHNNGNKQR